MPDSTPAIFESANTGNYEPLIVTGTPRPMTITVILPIPDGTYWTSYEEMRAYKGN